MCRFLCGQRQHSVCDACRHRPGFLQLPISKFDIIDLVLPPLSEHGRRQLLEQSELPGGAVLRALDQDRTLQSLCDGTLGIPGAIKVLGAAMTAHFNNGHELGRYALILKHLHVQGPCQVF